MTCKECGIEFKPRRSWQGFCSKKCRTDHHNKGKVNMAKTFQGLTEEEQKILRDFLKAIEEDPSLLVKLAEKLEEEDV